MSFSLEALAKQAKWLGTLGRILPWGRAQKPSWQVADVIIQDEYTHDVILTCADGSPSVLVLDCT